ncbi:hypothetical protein OIU76_020995, partial [Salix suchowensis]
MKNTSTIEVLIIAEKNQHRCTMEIDWVESSFSSLQH